MTNEVEDLPLTIQRSVSCNGLSTDKFINKLIPQTPATLPAGKMQWWVLMLRLTASNTSWAPHTSDKEHDIIRNHPSESCDPDPLHTYLLKQVLKDVKNSTLSKRSPLLKTVHLGKELLKNYRQLKYWLNIFVNVVAQSLKCYLNPHKSYDNHRFTYRTGHFTDNKCTEHLSYYIQVCVGILLNETW